MSVSNLNPRDIRSDWLVAGKTLWSLLLLVTNQGSAGFNLFQPIESTQLCWRLPDMRASELAVAQC